MDHSLDSDRNRDLFRAHQHYMPPSPVFIPSFAAGPAPLCPSVARFGDPVHRGPLLAWDDPSWPFFDWEQPGGVRFPPPDILASRYKRPRADPALFESGRAMEIMSDHWEGSHTDRRNHQEWGRNPLESGPAPPFSPSSLLDETESRQSVGSFRKPVRERLSRPSLKKPPPGVRHSPLGTKQFGNPSKKAKGNPSVSGPLTASLKGKNPIVGDRPRVKERGVKAGAAGPFKANSRVAAVVSVDDRVDGPVQSGPRKRAKRRKKKTEALASLNSLSPTAVAINVAASNDTKTEEAQAVGKVIGTHSASTKIPRSEVLRDTVDGRKQIDSSPNWNLGKLSKIKDSKVLNTTTVCSPRLSLSSNSREVHAPRINCADAISVGTDKNNEVKLLDEIVALDSTTMNLKQNIGVESMDKVSFSSNLDNKMVDAVHCNVGVNKSLVDEQVDQDTENGVLLHITAGSGKSFSLSNYNLCEGSENKDSGLSVLGEQKITGSDKTDYGEVDTDAKMEEELDKMLCLQEVCCGFTDNSDKGFVDMGCQAGGLVDCHKKRSLRGKDMENESERGKQIEVDFMKVQKCDGSTAALHFIERKKSNELDLKVKNIVLDEDEKSGAVKLDLKEIQQDGDAGREVGNQVGTGQVMEVFQTNLNGERVVSACKSMGKKTFKSSPNTDQGQICVDNRKPAEKPLDKEAFGSNSDDTHPLKSQMKICYQLTEKMPPLSKELKVDSVSQRTKMSSNFATSFSAQTSFPLGSIKRKTSTSLNHITNRGRTWRRTGNNNSSTSTSPVHESSLAPTSFRRESRRNFLKPQTTSYIRKGHSLVRKTSPVCNASPSLVPTNGEGKKHAVAHEIGASPSIERPKTPLFNTSKLVNVTGRSDATPYLVVCPTKPSETLSAVLAEVNNDKSKPTYVKCKSNQLIATSKSEMPEPIKEKVKLSSVALGEGYYKRKKNQIVRSSAPSEAQSTQSVALTNENRISETQKVIPKAPLLKYSRSLSKRRFQKVFQKTCKPSKFSLVWTLSSAQSQKDDRISLQRKKVLPYLFPWKRTTYLRYSMSNIASHPDKNSLSLIRKLLQFRKRDAVYTRSTTGFSLRKSKVLSINTRSLKWSKSIERHSKKVNKEATMAFAAAEQKKRGQSGVAFVVSDTVEGNCSSSNSAHGINLLPGERILRVGSDQYKMDASNKTLVRISDEKMSTTTDVGAGSDSAKCFEPRRLLIGKDEYICTGKGNKLVRDARKLKHILASEKVRWSLHTARLKLAKKQQYCQFFTRFGKCNKENGKCPYIHDPNKIAVCTKFLKGLCLGLNCKLTHKVIPERMQDCSYFLQGLCTNENCPYRHVNVNPKATVCEGFLRGYCADGNECQKKHTYVCPHFEEKGVCPLGPLCKLHHPKKRSKCRKRKRIEEQRNGRGRYFGCLKLIDGGGIRSPVSENQTAELVGGDIFLCDGQYADYISLDIGEEEAEIVKDPVDRYSILAESESSEPQTDNLDDLIRPVRLMRRGESKTRQLPE
ncbi:uncharacterized protein [Aristolochia californica]|uniref:uncharacterized protein isoform X2 n=1 Tax=Aristolochia californica TaxID=171875 RepID=UPI0035DC4F2B